MIRLQIVQNSEPTVEETFDNSEYVKVSMMMGVLAKMFEDQNSHYEITMYMDGTLVKQIKG